MLKYYKCGKCTKCNTPFPLWRILISFKTQFSCPKCKSVYTSKQNHLINAFVKISGYLMGIYIYFSKASVPSVIACAILTLVIIFINISTLEIEETKQEEITMRHVK